MTPILSFSNQLFSGKIPADRRQEKYIKTELNVKKSSLSIRKSLPQKRKITFIKKALRRLSIKI